MRAAAADFWGQPDKQKTIVPGVIWYWTPGHGGVVVSTELFPLNEAAFEQSFMHLEVTWVNSVSRETTLRIVGFEEDEDWAWLFRYHPDLLPIALRKGGIFAADASVEYMREHVEMLTNSALEHRAAEAVKATEPELWAKSAWGDWAADVPKGMVKVVTRADTVVFVPKDDYKPGERGFGYTEGA